MYCMHRLFLLFLTVAGALTAYCQDFEKLTGKWSIDYSQTRAYILQDSKAQYDSLDAATHEAIKAQLTDQVYSFQTDQAFKVVVSGEEVYTGTWELTGDKLTLQYPNDVKLEHKINIYADEMTLWLDPNGLIKRLSLKRMEP